MQHLQRIGRTLAAGVLAFSLAPAAFAEGTDAGTAVTNNVTLSFDVNSVSQTANASVTFQVDRKLVLDVTTQNGDWVTAIPGQVDTPGAVAALDYLITNQSNDAVDVVIAVVDRAATAVTGFTAQSGSPAAFNPSPATGTVWNDLNDNDAIDGGEQSAALDPSGVTQLAIGSLTENQTTNVKVIVDVAAGAAGDQYRTFTVVAAVANGGTVLAGDDSGNAAPGGSSTDIANGLNSVEVVFADAASANAEDIQFNFVAGSALASADAQYDGQSADTSGFITVVALSVAKHVEVLYDPISGNAYDGSGAASGVNPKALPGAVMLYVVGVVNGTASLSGQNVSIDDDIPDAAGEVLVGDQANPATAVDVPVSVTFDVGGTATTFTLDRTSITSDLDSIWVHGCQAVSAAAQAFGAGDPEVDGASLGTCAGGEKGYVAYLVTINDAP